MEINEPKDSNCWRCYKYSPMLLLVYLYGRIEWLCVKCRDYQIGIERSNQ